MILMKNMVKVSLISLLFVFLLSTIVLAEELNIEVKCPASVKTGSNIECPIINPDNVNGIKSLGFFITVTGPAVLDEITFRDGLTDFSIPEEDKYGFAYFGVNPYVDQSVGKIKLTTTSVGGDVKVTLTGIDAVLGNDATYSNEEVVFTESTIAVIADADLCTWETGEWGVCNADCGKVGTKTREVTNTGVNGCNEINKPSPSVSCTAPACDDPCKDVICVSKCEGTDHYLSSCSDGECLYDVTENSPKCIGPSSGKTPYKLTLLKARISTILDQGYTPEDEINNDDLTGYEYTDNNFKSVSQIASALKDYFATTG